MKKIVIASGNKGKIDEISKTLGVIDLELFSQNDLGVTSVPETGLSFVENALIKARHASEVTGLPVIADDSGLEVDYLHGAPGIYSARFAGENASDADNNNKLIQELHHVIHTQPSARFHCVIVFLEHAQDPTPILCQGTWEGHIIAESKGAHGFGYDPIFKANNSDRTAAEHTPDEKNKISHRGQALKQLVSNPKLQRFLNSTKTV